jgi:hypothetical protein
MAYIFSSVVHFLSAFVATKHIYNKLRGRGNTTQKCMDGYATCTMTLQLQPTQTIKEKKSGMQVYVHVTPRGNFFFLSCSVHLRSVAKKKKKKNLDCVGK